MEAKFTTPYHPVRVADLHPGVIVGVAGVEGQALWCARTRRCAWPRLSGWTT